MIDAAIVNKQIGSQLIDVGKGVMVPAQIILDAQKKDARAYYGIDVNKELQKNTDMSFIGNVWTGVKSFVSDVPKIVSTQAKATGKILTGDFKGAGAELSSLKQLPIDSATKEIVSRMEQSQNGISSDQRAIELANAATQINALAAAKKSGFITAEQYAQGLADIQKSVGITATSAATTKIGTTPVVMNDTKKDNYTTAPIQPGITPGTTTITTTNNMNTVVTYLKKYWYLVIIAGVLVWYFLLRKKR